MNAKQKIVSIINELPISEGLELCFDLADHCGVDRLDLIKGLATWGKEEPSSDKHKDYAKEEPADYGFKVGDRVTWGDMSWSFEISSIDKGFAYFKPGSGLAKGTGWPCIWGKIQPHSLSELTLI